MKCACVGPSAHRKWADGASKADSGEEGRHNQCSGLTEKKSRIGRVDFLCINKVMLMVYSDLGVIVRMCGLLKNF